MINRKVDSGGAGFEEIFVADWRNGKDEPCKYADIETLC